MSQSVREYIEARCVPVPFSGCWLWLLSTGSHGYGNASKLGARVVLAHRLSFEAYKGPIPPGMVVQHSCDERLCVNPDHLSLGTHKTNSDDKISKGRSGQERRRSTAGRKMRWLTPGEVAAIRCADESHVKTARRLGMNWKHISRVRAGKAQKDVGDVEPDPLPLLPEEYDEIDACLRAAALEDEAEVEARGGISSKPTTRVEVYAAALEAGDAA